MAKHTLSKTAAREILTQLESRFAQNMSRHRAIKWADVQKKLERFPDKLWSLAAMEDSGGEPDVLLYDATSDTYIFCDCAPESPDGRRSLCYDPDALKSRRENKPKDSAVGMAAAMGIELLTEDLYRTLQEHGPFDQKTSSWIATPSGVRERGGALFGDYRYGRVFTYHNGAESYYAARGFRGILKV
ncbi:MAG: DUF4256 domain-containing protein [Deltaproteobacteria bacterium]|nr:DUF4256 domain-containing protein [Deltaproteobacteria bacterium]